MWKPLEAISAALDRGLFADRAGTTFGGLRDLDRVLGHKQSLSVQDHLHRYRRGGLARTIVRAYPEATWSAGAVVYEDPDPEVSTPFEAAVASLASRLSLWQRLFQVDVQASLGEYSLLVIGAPGTSSTELTKNLRPEDVAYLLSVGQGRASILSRETDTGSARFDRPVMYSVSTEAGKYHKVHHSRVVHIALDCETGDLVGSPTLEPVWNLLDDLDKIVGGGAEAAWRRMDPGLHIDVDKDLLIEPEEEDALSDEVDDYVHRLSRVLKTRGVKVQPLSAEVSDFGANTSSVLQLVAGTTGIPLRLLVGSERGELASSQDERAFNARVSSRRKTVAEPIVRTLIDRLIDYNIIPRPKEYHVSWPETEETDEAGKSEIVSKLAEANWHQREAGLPPILASGEVRELVYRMSPLTDEQLEQESESARRVAGSGTGAGLGAEPGAGSGPAQATVDAREKTVHAISWEDLYQVADRYQDDLELLVTTTWDYFSEIIDYDRLGTGLEHGDQVGAFRVVDASLSDADKSLTTDLSAWLTMICVDCGLACSKSATASSSFLAADESTGPAVLEGTVGSHTYKAIYGSGPARAGEYWTLYVDGELRSHFRQKEGVYRFLSRIVDNPGPLKYSFDLTDKMALSWARERSAGLVKEISEATRQAIRELIAAGIEEGIPPRQLASEIRAIVGLRSDQVRAVDNLRARLATAEPGSTIQAGSVSIKVPAKGLTIDQIEAHAAKYASRLRSQRALLIARTETIDAANQGQRLFWEQNKAAGFLPVSSKRVWIVTPDDRLDPKICAPMAGQIAGLEEAFVTGAGQYVQSPPAHPACRCAVGIASPEDIIAWEGRS